MENVLFRVVSKEETSWESISQADTAFGPNCNVLCNEHAEADVASTLRDYSANDGKITTNVSCLAAMSILR